MRRLIVIILLICAFAGGYHLGRQKDSPDLIGYARQAVVTVAAVAGDVADSFSDDNPGRSDAADNHRADARASGDSRPYADTRAYVNENYARESSRYAPAAPVRQDSPTQAGTEVAQADGKTDLDLASRIWKSLQGRPEGK